jgi:transcriptional regulator with XRE-family HTH domain
MPDESFALRFRRGRRQKKMTQAAIAKALGISQSAIAQWESGRSFPSVGMAAKIEQLLSVKYRVGEGGAGEKPRPGSRERARIPVVGVPAAGDEERILVDGNPKGEVLAPPQLETVPGASAVYVRGRSMEPRYFPGEVVYLHPSRRPNPGDFVFLTVTEPGFPTDVGYIRQYVAEDLVHFRLRMLNPKREYVVRRESMKGMMTIVGSGLF